MAKNLFTLTVKTTQPADSELLVGGTGSANAYNFTWTKLREWIGDTVSFVFTGLVGFGTPNPISIVHIKSDIRFSWLNNETDYLKVGASDNSGFIVWENGTTGEIFIGNSFDSDDGDVHIVTKASVDDNNIKMTIQGNGNVSIPDGDLSISGALSKGSGSFKIDHPLKPDTHYLVHSFTESPKADLIYRDTIKLVNGKAEVNIDLVSDMTEGTFDALCGNVQCFTTNETGWDLVKGSIKGNILTIQSKTLSSTDTISWMVIGERKDKHMIETSWTDKDGHVIVEPLKPIKEEIKDVK